MNNPGPGVAGFLFMFACAIALSVTLKAKVSHQKIFERLYCAKKYQLHIEVEKCTEDLKPLGPEEMINSKHFFGK